MIKLDGRAFAGRKLRKSVPLRSVHRASADPVNHCIRKTHYASNLFLPPWQKSTFDLLFVGPSLPPRGGVRLSSTDVQYSLAVPWLSYK